MKPVVQAAINKNIECIEKCLIDRMSKDSKEGYDFDFFDEAEKKSSKDTPNEYPQITSQQDLVKSDADVEDQNCNKVEEQQSQSKDLMNCIAFEKQNENAAGDSSSKLNEVRYSDDFDSLSSDTTSDITDVSPQPPSPPLSSSGCSSLVKTEIDVEMSKGTKNELCSKKIETNDFQNRRKSETINNTDQDERTLTFLKDAIHSLRCADSVKTSFAYRTQGYFRSQNMTFNKEQMRNIDRENKLLLRKIQCHKKKPKPSAYAGNTPKVPSSAINRERQQRKIEFENSILLKKIEQVKGTTNTMAALRRY